MLNFGNAKNLGHKFRLFLFSVDWTCPICQKSFKNRRDRLEEHIETVHEGKKSYQCQKCATFFTTKPGLIHHEKSVHEGIRHHCQICNADFASTRFEISAILSKQPYFYLFSIFVRGDEFLLSKK